MTASDRRPLIDGDPRIGEHLAPVTGTFGLVRGGTDGAMVDEPTQEIDVLGPLFPALV